MDALVLGWIVLSLLSFTSLQFLSAPYGRHARPGWGPNIPSALGWVLMEAPAVVVPLVFLGMTERRGAATLALTAMWLLHYINRTFVWPMRMRLRGKTMPLVIAAMAFGTNVVIDGLNFAWLYVYGPERGVEWLSDGRFWAGSLLFFVGLAINWQSDGILRNLRAPGETGYKVPYGGAYRWVSCPNYLGELMEWAGFAIAVWSLPALAFFVWSVSNLAPRARAHHRWYTETFPDYPPERRALLPWIW